jgi:predicted Zn finger-like uncharacterized protein
MIAACPKCAARFRIERERLAAGSVRLRCSRCEAVFRVRAPEVPEPVKPAERPAAHAPLQAPHDPARRPAPAASAAHSAATRAETEERAPVSPREPAARGSAPAGGDSVLVAMSDAALAARTARLLSERGYSVQRAADGVEAMLEIQRKLPRAVVLAADLPKMFGFQICEIVKRNASLAHTWVVLVGAIHNPDRYRREASDLYGADAYLEGPALPEGLLPLLEQGGVRAERPPREASAPAPAPRDLPRAPAARAASDPVPSAASRPAPVAAAPLPGAAAAAKLGASATPQATSLAPPDATSPAPSQATSPAAAKAASGRAPTAGFAPQPAAVPGPAAAHPRADDGLDAERAKAERLARIVVSDIVLYNEERFSAAARAGNVLTVMAADLAEGRALFDERIDARVRAERDHLTDELLRSAKLRGMR